MANRTRLLTLCALLVSTPAFAADIGAGDRCALEKNVRISAKARGRGRKTRVKMGTELEVVAIEKKWAEVKLGDTTGFIKVKQLDKRCAKLEPPPETTPGTGAEQAGAEPVEAGDDSNVAGETADSADSAETPEETAEAAMAETAEPIEAQPAEPEEPTAAAEEDDTGKTKVAVMAVRGAEGMPQELLDSLTALIPQVLDDLGPFKSITSDDIQQMLAMEALKQSLGCSDVSCLAEIGGAIGADYMVTGSVITVGDKHLVQFQLMDIGEARVVERVSRESAGGPAGLVEEIRTTTKLLVRDILAHKSGTLHVSVQEEGATIKLDGTIVGVSPLEPLTVAGGTHTVAIEKEGFVLYSRDVDIGAKEETRLDAVLLPSEEFKRDYESGADVMRALAWVGTGVGVAALGAGTALVFVSKSKADAARPDFRAYNHDPSLQTRDEQQRLDTIRNEVAMYDALALTMGVVGLSAIGAGVALFLLGPDPDRFDAETRVGIEPSATLSVFPGGVGITGTF